MYHARGFALSGTRAFWVFFQLGITTEAPPKHNLCTYDTEFDVRWLTKMRAARLDLSRLIWIRIIEMQATQSLVVLLFWLSSSLRVKSRLLTSIYDLSGTYNDFYANMIPVTHELMSNAAYTYTLLIKWKVCKPCITYPGSECVLYCGQNHEKNFSFYRKGRVVYLWKFHTEFMAY